MKDRKKLEEELQARYVSGILRTDLQKIFGISSKCAANADSKGIGPDNRYYCRGRVCYPVSDLLDWLYGKEEGSDE